ncbi:hypothetical protein BCR34DRAFT_588595 [Clohesyomyces aquaticus]|uniref:Uncharacterized protein n=1 Tax=Clohesyomyces aquaticus TaxID=1231657 RepID=A0A1Y1ZJE0_9PLEO|nr:hypothetical protein BCR34DRAFT_588595 [Clohesyomyces aquaticus]
MQSKRAPLSDKTEISLSTFDSTPLYVAANWGNDETPINVPAPTASAPEEIVKNAGCQKLKRSGAAGAIKIPTKSGENEDTGGEKTSRPSTPAQNGYGHEVPNTVARKKWDF